MESKLLEEIARVTARLEQNLGSSQRDYDLAYRDGLTRALVLLQREKEHAFW